MKKQKSLLWEIQHPESVYQSYVFGTMHLRGDEAYAHYQLALNAMDQCQALALEYNLDEGQQTPSSHYFELPEGQSLTDIVGEKKYKKMRKIFLKAFNVDLDFCKNMIPLIVINLISESVFSQERALPLDSQLWAEGVERGLRLSGVETFAAQMETLQKIPLSFQMKAIKSIASNVTRYRKNILALAKAYTKQDIHKLYKESKRSLGATKKVLLYNRNETMADSIWDQSKGQNVFFGIGAAHLAGQRGVLKLLKDRGLKLRAIPNKNKFLKG